MFVQDYSLLKNSLSAASDACGVPGVHDFKAKSWSNVGIVTGVGPGAGDLTAFFNSLRKKPTRGTGPVSDDPLGVMTEGCARSWGRPPGGFHG